MTSAGKVVITSANCATAGFLIPRLREKGYHTTGLIRQPAAIGTDAIITDWMNSDAAKTALAGADYIIHLSGDANAANSRLYKEANYDTTRRVADSARNGKVRRIIYISYSNAGTHQKNLYLHYKGHAENLLLSTGKEVVIFRCPVIIDAPGRPSRIDPLFVSQKGKAVPAIGSGQQKMHPVYRGDVVNAILSALEKGHPGRYELSGPEEMTVDEFIHIVNDNPATPAGRDHARQAGQKLPVRIRHIPGWLAILLSRLVPGLSPTFVDLMLHHTDSLYSPATYGEFGLAPCSIIGLFSQPGNLNNVENQ